MNTGQVSTWADKLQKAIKADPKKAGMLGVLTLVLLVMVGRVLLGGAAEPKPAAAALSVQGEPIVRTPVARSPQREKPAAAMAQWLANPALPLSRNLFSVKFDCFPTDNRAGGRNFEESAGFWDQVGKSKGLAADQVKEYRQALLQRLRGEAKVLKLQSILMGSNPKAMIEGELVGEGDVVKSFRVLKIEARRIIIEREGIKLEKVMD